MIHCVLLLCTQTCYHIILYFFHGGEGSRKKRYVTKRGYQIKHYRPLRREHGGGGGGESKCSIFPLRT